MNFLALWSSCWSSSYVHFKNGLEYLIRGTAQVFSLLMRFLLETPFFFVWQTLLLFFLSSPLVWECPLLILPRTYKIHFLWAFWFFLSILLLPFFAFFHLSLLTWYIFQCQILSLHLNCIFLFFVFESPVLFHFFFSNILMSSIKSD